MWRRSRMSLEHTTEKMASVSKAFHQVEFTQNNKKKDPLRHELYLAQHANLDSCYWDYMKYFSQSPYNKHGNLIQQHSRVFRWTFKNHQFFLNLQIPTYVWNDIMLKTAGWFIKK